MGIFWIVLICYIIALIGTTFIILGWQGKQHLALNKFGYFDFRTMWEDSDFWKLLLYTMSMILGMTFLIFVFIALFIIALLVTKYISL